MGLFKRGHRVAEGGGAADAASDTSTPTAAKASEDLGLFGADSDESDDDATIDRYANGGEDNGGDGDAETEQQHESKKVSALLAKLTPEELFARFDTDGSGTISVAEFLAMLPDLGIKMSEAKAIRIFKKCDTDGTGEIDLNEFRMAMFAVDPVSGNPLGFAPSQLLAPRDAFELFDEDSTGQIDELEFADVLEYFGLDVSDGKQEKLFRKYDKDKSGSIDYREFRAMWIRLTNVRDELERRGVEIPKYATPWKLQRLLEARLDQEEAKEALVLNEAKKFLDRQREMQRRQQLAHRAKVRAQDELAAALDAAGQVYVLGTGKYKQFTGTAAVRDEELVPDFEAVRELWAFRVGPKVAEPVTAAPVKQVLSEQQKIAAAKEVAKQAKEQRRKLAQQQQQAALQRKQSKYVRRRPENQRWTFRSPPKLDAQTMRSLQREIKTLAAAAAATSAQRPNHNEGEETADREHDRIATNPEPEPVSDTAVVAARVDSEEELSRLFFQDREFVRSLRFRATVVMTNTGSLWGRGVASGALSDDVAIAVTRSGSVVAWGGKDKAAESGAIKQVAVLNAAAADDDNAQATVDTEGDLRVEEGEGLVVEKVTPRSSIVKMSTTQQLKAMDWDFDAQTREAERRKTELEQQEEDEWYTQTKSVVVYFGAYEPPPSHATRVRFMEHVLMPRLIFEAMQQSAQVRGLGASVARITKMELIRLLAGCFALEREVKGERGHEEIRQQEILVKELQETKDKKRKLQLEPERDKLLKMWEELLVIRQDRRAQVEADNKAAALEQLHRPDVTFDAMVARRHVQREDLIPEFTARGTNARIEISGITTRGPALHSPRGAVAVADVAVGGSHAALVLQNGSLFTWGIGSNGRLGHGRTHATQLTFDADHPQRVETFSRARIRQISCGFSHSAVVTVDGALCTWGSAVQGKLGVGLVEDQYEQCAYEPLVVKFPGNRLVRSVSCGASHTGAVSTQGELFMWGSAHGGRLGLGPHVKDEVVVPTLVKELVRRKLRVWQVACGHAHSALCTETTSEPQGGGGDGTTLQGGHVYVCGGAIPLGKYISVWELVAKLSESSVAIRQVSCGATHTAAVSAHGELYTWGRNAGGCTGHSVERAFVAEPELVRSLHVEPFNLALGKPCHQINVYNEQGPSLAVNGDIDGRLERCSHTHLEDMPWWEVDLGQPAVIDRIRVWNRTDEPSNPTRSRAEFAGRLFPCWILVSEFPFRRDLQGKEGLRAAKVQSTAFARFDEHARMTEWVLPTAQTVGQFVRVQLQGRNFLHLAEVQVLGVYSAFNYVGRVGAAHCGNEATLVVVPPLPQQSALHEYYLRAIQADADNAMILRQFEAFEACFRRVGRGSDASLGDKCRLCRVVRECEICEFYAQANLKRVRDEVSGALPLRLVGDRMGLSDLVRLAVDEGGLEQEAHEREAQSEEQQRAGQNTALATSLSAPTPTLLQKVLPGGVRKFTAGIARGREPSERQQGE